MTDYQNRIVRGKITQIGGTYIQLNLSDKGAGRLSIDNMVDPPEAGKIDQTHKIGQILTVFLVKETKPSFWLLNEHWVENNPWLDLRLGDKVYGTVSEYYETVAVFVSLDGKSGLEAFLHVNEMGFYSKIAQEVLEVGDRVYAEISDLDFNQLRVNISIKFLFEQSSSNALKSDSIILEKVEDTRIPTANLSGVYWLIIEDDHTLFQRLKEWGEGLGATIVRAKNIQHLEQQLKQNDITHASVDANLDHYKKDKASSNYLSTLIRHHSISTIVMSGKNKSRQLAQQYDIPFLLKPVAEDLLLQWLNNQKTLFSQSLKEQEDEWEDEAIHWQAEGLEFEIKEQAKTELSRLGKKYNCTAALIALKEREGVLQIRTQYGLVFGRTEEAQYQLVHTMVSNIIETGQADQRERNAFGNLITILPVGVRYAYGFPIKINSQHNRAVLFFRDTPFSKLERNKLCKIELFLQNLGEKLSLVQAWEEDRAFANLGRLNAAVMHELRNNINLIDRPIKNLASLTRKNKDSIPIEEISTSVDRLVERYKFLSTMLENNLNLIRQHRHSQFSLHDSLTRIISFYQYEYEEEKQASLHLQKDIPKLRLDFPVLAFEQTLINILQNALYHISPHTGSVSVGVLVHRPNKDGHSIFIDVVDNGKGIPASVKDKLFKPRETSKGYKGTGMGLYVSKNLLQAHGGDLYLLESVRYFGSCFRIALPQKFDDVL